MRSLILLSITCLLLASAPSATAAGFALVGSSTFTTEGFFISGRLSAMGSADLADSSPAALLINPAPLAEGNGVEASYDHMDFGAQTEFHSYGGSAEWNAWRLNLAVQDFVTEDAIRRSAFNPEGDGETFDARDRMTVLGASYDIGQAQFDNPSLHWSVGVAWRRFSLEFDEAKADADAMDLGTTFGWSTDYEAGWTRLVGTLSRMNVTDADLTVEERTSYLPSLLRAGLTLETAFRRKDREDDLIKLVLAFSEAFQKGNYYQEDTNHSGMELLFLEALAIRYGHSTRVTGDISSWGVGIILDDRILGAFTVQVDFGKMDFGNEHFGDDKAIWGVQARYDF